MPSRSTAFIPASTSHIAPSTSKIVASMNDLSASTTNVSRSTHEFAAARSHVDRAYFDVTVNDSRSAPDGSRSVSGRSHVSASTPDNAATLSLVTAA
jgi:hypothetical protein